MSEQKLGELRKAIENNKPHEISQIIFSKTKDVKDVINKKFTDGGFPPRQYTPLTYTIAFGHTECLSALLEAKDIDVNLAGHIPPLIFAMKQEQFDCFKILLADSRVNVNMPDKGDPYLYTPLIYSVSYKKQAYFQALLEQRAQDIDVNLYYKGNYTYPAIYWAVLRSEIIYLQTLLRQPGIKAEGCFSMTSLPKAIRSRLSKKNPSKDEDLTLLDAAIARGRLKSTDLSVPAEDTTKNNVTTPQLNNNTLKDPQPPNENKVTTLQTVDSTPPPSKSPPLTEDHSDEPTEPASLDKGKYKRRSGIFVAVAVPLIYTTGIIGIPLGFTRKPQETYEAFEKLHLHGFIDNLSELTMAQVMTGMIGGGLLIALLFTAGILIKNNPPPKVQNSPSENTNTLTV